MPGRPDFSQAGSKASGQKVATVDRPELQEVVMDQSDDVAAGATERVEIYAPVGATYEVSSMHLQAAGISGATGNHHQFQTRPLDTHGNLVGQSNPTDTLIWNNGTWQSATKTTFPSDEAAQSMSVESLMATENAPLVVTYTNDTDTAQTGGRTYTFVVTERTY